MFSCRRTGFKANPLTYIYMYVHGKCILINSKIEYKIERTIVICVCRIETLMPKLEYLFLIIVKIIALCQLHI